ncbi:MAG TPA: alpha/beta fold hydrolase [Ignavibacteria bacterium]|nr:alpha/beta fold hydrolase [Ignavibacteria bacterium]
MKLCLVFLIAMSFIISTSNAYGFGDLYEVKETEFFYELSDGVKLDCSIYKPVADVPANGWPVIIYCHGFGKSKRDVAELARSQAAFGYLTFIYSMRGQGRSKGESHLISRVEMEDLQELVAAIKKRKDASDDNVAITGSSQGGIIPFMASCYGMKVRCIISDLGSPTFASSWIQNGSIRMSLLWSLSYSDNVVRYDDDVQEFRKIILDNDPDDVRDFLEEFLENRDFSKEVINNQNPIMFSNSWKDVYFNSNGIIKTLSSSNKYNKFYFGAIKGHSSDTNLSETEYHNEMISKWIRYWLFSENNGVADTPKYTYSFGGYPIFENSWTYYRFSSNYSPFTNNKKIKFFLWNTKLEQYENYDKDSVLLLNDADENLTMREAINSEFTGNYFNSKFRKQVIIMDSSPLTYNYNVIGIPEITLNLKYTSQVYQINIQIWEVNEFNDVHFVSSINYTNWNNKSDKEIRKEIEGNAVAHTFHKGSRIRLVITNLDTRNDDSELRTNPYVLPVLNRNAGIIYTGGKNGSFIELPILE